MNRFRLFALATTIALTSFAAKADTVINLNATVANGPATSGGGTPNTLASSFYSTQTLSAGTYTVKAVGTTTAGAVYNGWSQGYGANGLAASGSWQERTGISFNNTSFTTAGGNNVFTAGATDKQIFTGLYTDAATALSAATSSYTFTLTSTTAVTFYIPDNSYPSYPGFTDNTGGVSLSLTAATPEPSSIIMLATGALTTAGMVRRRLMA